MNTGALLLGTPGVSLARRVEVTTDPKRVAERIAALPAARHQTDEAALVAITGIDGSGKGWLAAQVARALEAKGVRTGVIGIEPWQNPRTVRLSEAHPGPHFLEHAIRWDALFGSLIDPLRRARSIQISARLIDTAADRHFLQFYEFRDIDVILLEGIFLLKRELRERYDQAWWIDCPPDAAHRRAVERGQGHRSPEQAMADYERIYLPAQRYHLAVDSPVAAADGIFLNG
jgi:uridine kinase